MEVAHSITLQRLPQPGSQAHSGERLACGRINSSAADLQTYRRYFQIRTRMELHFLAFLIRKKYFYGSDSPYLTILVV